MKWKLIEAMASLVERLFVTALLAALLSGCGKNPPKAEVDSKAFDAAAPEIKQVWDQAVAAAASNDFGSAIATLRVLSRNDTSLPQRETVRNARVAYEGKTQGER